MKSRHYIIDNKNINSILENKNMNPFDANERHRYIIESGGNPVSSADGKEKEIWVNSINPLVELK